MFKKINERVTALFLAIVILVMSLPLSMLTLADDFVSENIMLNGVKSITPIVRNISAGNVYEHNQFNGNGAVSTINDGDTTNVKDVFGANDWGHNSGLLIEFNEAAFIGDIKLYSGYADYPDTYDIYASEEASAVYSDNSKVGSDVLCTGAARKIEVNKTVKYVAIFLTDYVYNGRIFELEVWTADPSQIPEGFVEENLLRTQLGEASGIIFDRTAKTATVNTKFDENGALTGALDGDTVVHTDVYGWDANTGVGALFTLNDTYYSDRVVVYSGLIGYPDKFTIYAGESLEDLYSEGNLVTAQSVCEGSKLEFELDRKVKYLSLIFDSDGGRIKEIELYSAEEKVFAPQNVLPSATARGILLNRQQHTATENTKFNENGALEAVIDGDTVVHADVYGWDANTGVGVEYTLAEVVYCGKAVIYSGLTGYPDKWRVYASETRAKLYSEDSLIVKELVCENEKLEITINQKIGFIAFVFDSNEGRVKEFELWTAEAPDGDETPEYDTDVASGGKKVLTIGNSFSENVSAYATEIAAAQGYDLLFGYLKYPSSTIEQHIRNAERNSQVYKFEYTGSMGRVTVKDGVSSFASIKDALTFTDWDIIVLQEGSTSSVDFNNYLNIGKLVEYVRSFAPDAEIMLHETWSWGIWGDLDDADTANDHEKCYGIIANYILASEILCEGATVIHSGMAIESARHYYNDHYKFNETDNGNYQHLNELGKYIAGATYVATIFDCDIKQNTFGNGVDTFAALELDEMRSIIDYVVNDGNDLLLEELKPLIDEMYEQLFGEPDNFIMRHLLDEPVEILQDVASGAFSNGSRFNLANSNAAYIAIDGDTMVEAEIYGALDWEYPKNVGVMYKLDASYTAEKLVVYAGLSSTNPTKLDVYAADSVGSLYNEDNKVADGIICVGDRIEIPLGKEISCLAFVITDYVGSAHVIEFDVVADDKPVVKEPIVWPQAPSDKNLLVDAVASKIIAPGGDFKGTKEFEYRLMEQNKEVSMGVLTDGSIEYHYDVWNLTEKDRPGVLYDLGAYYDLSHLHAWAGANESELIVNNGYKIYASENLADLYKDENLVFDYINKDDTTNEVGVDVDLKRIRFVAFLVTNSSDSAWRMREFAAYGTKSADQTQKEEAKSIIEEIEAEYYGVATDNLADPIYMGASDFIIALTDGSRDAVEFWGGADTENSCFVFIYNLYANYDLSAVDIYAFADNIEEDSGIHKGIRSAKVYASRKFDELFKTKPIVMKEDYTDPAVADENAYYSAEALPEWKGVRYIAYVFTIGDSRYGACRLEELKAFGTLSAVQDVEEEEAKLPQYIDVKADNGVVARIFALGANDDLSKLGAALNAECSEKSEDLKFVNDTLSGYKANALHKIEVVDASGDAIDLGGRLVRLSIPEKRADVLVACVDDYGAEIISSGTLNDCITVETATLRSYAIVSKIGAEKQANVPNKDFNILWVFVIALGAVALLAIGTAVIVILKVFKK